jgi:hypothetical protein
MLLYQNLNLYEQVKLFKEFVGCYVKPEILVTATSSGKLKRLDISSRQNLLKQEKMFLGSRATKIIEKSPAKDHLVKEFLKKVSMIMICYSLQARNA